MVIENETDLPNTPSSELLLLSGALNNGFCDDRSYSIVIYKCQQDNWVIQWFSNRMGLEDLDGFGEPSNFSVFVLQRNLLEEDSDEEEDFFL